MHVIIGPLNKWLYTDVGLNLLWCDLDDFGEGQRDEMAWLMTVKAQS